MPRLMLDCLVKQSQDKKTQLEVLVNLLHYLLAQLRRNLRNSSRMYGPPRGAVGRSIVYLTRSTSSIARCCTNRAAAALSSVVSVRAQHQASLFT